MRLRFTRREMIGSLVSLAACSASPAGRVRAATGVLDFLVVGDWGRQGGAHQREVAARMSETAQRDGSRCVISVGDNFYENGVESAVDPQWHASFESIYSAPSLQIPWYAVLGNHDYRGKPQAQVEYAKTSARWKMPSRYYAVGGETLGAPHLDLFFLDTSPLVHAYRGEVLGAIAANVASQDPNGQLQWLDRELARSQAPWKVLVGHQTIFSGGSAHGDTPEMIQSVVPLLHKHGVQAYINGHDHDLQHVRRDGIDYIGCGGGSEARPVRAVDGTLFCAARCGFASMRSTGAGLSLEFIDSLGASLHRAEIGALRRAA